MGKNVAVFVDVANIFYAAKAAGVDIDYVTLLKSASAGRDLVRAYAYTGLDPDNENQRNFHDFLRRSNYKVVSKDIRKYGDGKVKANLDIELVVDMMKTARNLDIAIIVSGDGDFAPAIRAVQEMGVRVEVISFRGNTSSDLIEAADLFSDITQLARVERGSRSGRRVAEDDADLSMTEVPDKQTEGTGLGRGRGGRGGRGRTRTGEPEPVAASARGRGRGRGVAVASTNGVGSGVDSGTGPVALPGERLSRVVGNLTEADLAAAEVFTLDDDSAEDVRPTDVETDIVGREDENGDEPRRRRRRGGRGRGRGRGRDEAVLEGTAAPTEARPERPAFIESEEDEEEPPVAAPRAPRSTPFGSVWDSQLGTPTAPLAANLEPLPDDEEFDEPEIPEYLIAEQRRGASRGGGRSQAGGNRGGPRGGRAAYQSAIERERYGRGGGGGGINRYPDVSARTGQAGQTRQGGAPRDDRSFSGERRERDDGQRTPAPRPSAEPWSEVPPELEAMLRAQVSQQPVTTRSDSPSDAVVTDTQPADAEAPTLVEGAAEAEAAQVAETPAPKRRSTRTAKAVPAEDAASALAPEATTDETAEAAAPRRRTTRASTSRAAKADATADAAATDAATDTATDAATAAPTPRRRTTRKAAAPATPADGVTEGPPEGTPDDAAPEATEKPAPRRRTTRKTAPATES